MSEDFRELGDFTIDPAAVRLLGHRFAIKHLVVVLGSVDPAGRDAVTVGMLDPRDGELRRQVETVLRRPVAPVRLNAYEIRRAIDAGHGIARDGEDDLRLTLGHTAEVTFDPAAPASQIVTEILGRAAHLGASDIHVEVYEDDVDVRFRIDGLLHHVATPVARDNVRPVISRIKILAGLDIAERRVAQDGRINAVLETHGARRKVDFRVSVTPGPFGEDAVLRVLDSSSPLVGLPALGLGEDVLATFERLVRNPEGLVIVTGPTGSGKTTTLYSALARLQDETRKVLTVEDPIEYFFDKINQKQVTPAMGFAAYARAFMRQNPDVILIGEIRDEETADVALRAAHTGHLVLSTLHANDGVRTVSRLLTLGVDPSILAGSLLGALAQRLARRLCAECRRETPPPADLRRQLLLADDDRGPYFEAPGCRACGGDGYRGRVGLFELFVVDEEAADLIVAGRPVHELRRHALGHGMTSLLQDALRKARAGATSLAEIARVVPYRIIAADREP